MGDDVKSAETTEVTAVAVKPEAEANVAKTAETKPDAEKTYTKADIDKAIKDAVKKERSKAPAKEDWEEFQAYKQAKMTDAEKQTAAETAKAEAEAKAERLERKLTLIGAGVATQYADDALALVEVRVAAGEEQDKAIAEILKTYPSFRAQAEAPAITTGVRAGAIKEADAGESAAGFVDIIKAVQAERN